MNRLVGAVVAAAVGGTLVTSVGQAQVSLFVQGGPSFPVGEYGDDAKTGWLAAGGFMVPVGGRGFSAGGELMVGSNKHSDTSGDKTNLFGGFAFAGYRFGDPARPGFYLLGQAGVLNHQYKPGGSSASSDDDWKLAVGGGAGVDIPAGSVTVFVEGRFVTRSGTSFLPIMAGVAIPIGGSR